MWFYGFLICTIETRFLCIYLFPYNELIEETASRRKLIFGIWGSFGGIYNLYNYKQTADVSDSELYDEYFVCTLNLKKFPQNARYNFPFNNLYRVQGEFTFRVLARFVNDYGGTFQRAKFARKYLDPGYFVQILG